MMCPSSSTAYSQRTCGEGQGAVVSKCMQGLIERGVFPAHLHSNGTQAALKRHSESNQRAIRGQSESTQRALREHSESTQRAIRLGSRPMIAYLCQRVDVCSECLVGHHHQLHLVHSRAQSRALLGTSPVLKHTEPIGATEFGRLGAPVRGEGGRADDDGREVRWGGGGAASCRCCRCRCRCRCHCHCRRRYRRCRRFRHRRRTRDARSRPRVSLVARARRRPAFANAIASQPSNEPTSITNPEGLPRSILASVGPCGHQLARSEAATTVPLEVSTRPAWRL